MNTRKTIASLMGGAAMVAAVVGMTAGLAPASAAPSPTPGATLSVTPQDIVGPNYDRIILDGVYPMQEPDAVGFITPPQRQRLRRDALHRLGRRRKRAVPVRPQLPRN